MELLAAGPSVELVLPPPASPEVLATLNRFLAQALPPVLSSLQASAPRNEVERALEELLRTLRLVGPLPAFKVRWAAGGGPQPAGQSCSGMPAAGLAVTTCGLAKARRLPAAEGMPASSPISHASCLPPFLLPRCPSGRWW